MIIIELESLKKECFHLSPPELAPTNRFVLFVLFFAELQANQASGQLTIFNLSFVHFLICLAREMFGDLFGQRADYSDGMFYAGHRKYLNTQYKSGLEPPNEFKTKRQFKSAKRLEKHDAGNLGENAVEKMSFHINFQKKNHEGRIIHFLAQPTSHFHQLSSEFESHSELNKKFKKVATIIKTTVILEHFSSMSKLDWIEDIQAGCHIWINKNTGEVVSVCPWLIHPGDETPNSGEL